ncbi:MAG: hypothetical protein QXD23_00535, partial [Candidatus Micrarchaeaceae archaeon]
MNKNIYYNFQSENNTSNYSELKDSSENTKNENVSYAYSPENDSKEELPWEKNEREKKETAQNFLSKYWMLIIILILLIALPFTLIKINFSNLLNNKNTGANLTKINTSTANLNKNTSNILNIQYHNLSLYQVSTLFNIPKNIINNNWNGYTQIYNDSKIGSVKEQ